MANGNVSLRRALRPSSRRLSRPKGCRCSAPGPAKLAFIMHRDRGNHRSLSLSPKACRNLCELHTAIGRTPRAPAPTPVVVSAVGAGTLQQVCPDPMVGLKSPPPKWDGHNSNTSTRPLVTSAASQMQVIMPSSMDNFTLSISDGVATTKAWDANKLQNELSPGGLHVGSGSVRVCWGHFPPSPRSSLDGQEAPDRSASL